MKIKELLEKLSPNYLGNNNYEFYLKSYDGIETAYSHFTEAEVATLRKWVEAFPEAECQDHQVYHAGKFYELAEQGGFKQVTTVITTKYWTVDELINYGR